MNVTINLGNVWEMLGAIGTILAVIVSLYLAFKDNKKITIELTPDIYFGKSYNLSLYKNPLDVFHIVEFGYISYGKKNSIEGEDRYYELLNEKDTFISDAKIPFVFGNDSVIKINLSHWDYSKLENRSVRFYIKDSNGKIYKSPKTKIMKLE